MVNVDGFNIKKEHKIMYLWLNGGGNFMDVKEYIEQLELIDDSQSRDALKNLGIDIYKSDRTKREKYDILCELADIFRVLTNPEYNVMKVYICRCLVGVRYSNKLQVILDVI